MATRAPASIGMSLEEVETPALLLDLDAFERNLKRMADAASAAGVRLRPHAKSHKCPPIALRQIDYGAVGICCQKVSEAEAMIHGGVRDVYVCNEIVDPAKIQRLAALAGQAHVSVAVDNPSNIQTLSAAALSFGVELAVLVEINVGSDRCGVEPGDPATELARQITKLGGLRFGGLQAYNGRAQHLPTYGERKEAIESVVEKARMTKSCLERAGILCEQITGAGTGTYFFELTSGVFTEVQPGSYIFMDVEYGSIKGKDGGLYRDFENSLFVYAQVMSCVGPDHVVLDAGLKAYSAEKGLPWVYGMPGVESQRVSDEHTVLKINSPNHSLQLGEKVKLVPPHCDPAVNLYDWLVCFRNNRVQALWPITARGPGY
jgi:3-hydroxy-D-aspartate aldolase